MIRDAKLHRGRDAKGFMNSAKIVVHDIQRNGCAVVLKVLLKAFVRRVKRRCCIRRMAELGKGPYKGADIAGYFKKKGAAFGPVRDSLIKKGMIYSPRYGEIDFTVPLFDEFMRRALPSAKAKPK